MATATHRPTAPWLLQETVLPWSASADEDTRFGRFLRTGLILFALLGAAVTLIPVPELTREQAERIPPQLAKVILEKQQLPEPQPKAKPKPEPRKAEKKKPEPKPEPEKKPEPKPEPKEKPPAAEVKLAREKAANSGLLQMQDDLQAMRESVDVAEVSGAQLAGSAAEAQTVQRSVIGDRAKASSGGVKTTGLSQDTGGTALAARETTQVSNAQASGSAREVAKKVRREKSARAEQSIRSVMEANKGAIYAIYNRALRRDPMLQGKVTVKLVIESNGSVSAISIVDSELNNPSLERKLLARIRLINFGAANVEQTTLNYSIDFLPS
ncbi:AgmX/PglI C-terminal domain-containing protein [Microbulbifer litoralis]|uniref:AgmX/PglI C-terminal domain-containing protein n=1 Tax=Microbulbifer litoralis TaxID=2933965 RepID=UPI0020279779|nr:AgmX/PglI C-terminal domain-containing protein [Microbulbifer sp. GX H0434]